MVVDQIGNGCSTSPHSTDEASIAMSKFPQVDEVDAALRELFAS